MTALFVYGELCKPPVLVEILDRLPPASPALLRDYRRERDPATGYYRAVHHADAVIPGLVLEDIGAADLKALDRYENVAGGEYERVEADAELIGTGAKRERVYVYASVRGADQAGC